LHGLGKLPMIACFGDLYEQAIEASNNKDMSLFSAENGLIGFNHRQVGLLIGTRWKLDTEMQLTIAHHHKPLDITSDSKAVLHCISLVNLIAYRYGIGSAWDFQGDPMLSLELADRISMSMDILFDMKPMIEEEIDKAKVFLNKKG
jgi:HD-like signal output (HDOD) protein